MTDEDEIRILRLEKRNAELTAQNVGLRKRVEDLQRMHEQDQKYINTLRRQIGATAKERAELHFQRDE
ncbi:hypothetical protein [Roseovarius sp. MMSF_3350]|uniref:hypothetical protein n=1 Tax=Roseovarius sp. MMSF_3350 TaxID=3046706 RepID=UPI00273FA06C|nr:hypothetical protein [Roseovarius sp. MMSF_3350]